MAIKTIIDVQHALARLGYDIGPAGVDGEIGGDTGAAVQSFQRARGLVADGIPGDITKAALDAALAGREIPRNLPADPPWLTLALADIGVREKVGAGSNPVVLAYYADAGFAGIKDDAVAWCAAGLGAWLKRSGAKPSGSLLARSYEKWGVGLAVPIYGCIGTKKRSLNDKSGLGHVGIVVAASATRIWMVGANQGDAVNVQSFPRDEFTSWRWASEYPVPTSPLKMPTSYAGAGANTKQS